MTTQPHMSGVTRREDEISHHECRAMRALDSDVDYTRSEIAFMFETQTRTVSRHAEKECHHARLRRGDEMRQPKQDYTDRQLLSAFRLVYENQPYQEMSQGTYDDHRPEDFPAAATIHERFGGWPEARALAHGEQG